ncbi:MAG: NAD-dependent epimerase/dehydratase family protein [Deltaproteobacteria bacterium]|nr:NAD-dependent epimerase/dehydratase family protein [Candidatus Zymogenaceae bacterium]
MKVLITGAGGFIGSHLVRALADDGWEMRGLFLPNEDASAAREHRVEVFWGDLTDPATLTGVADGCDVVFHLATRVLDYGSHRLFRRIMVDGTKHLLEASAHNAPRFVYVSSIAAHGLDRNIPGAEEDAPRVPCGVPYSDTKMEAEDLVREFCDGRGMSWVIVRPANVIGPGSVWVKDVLDAFFRGPLPVIDNGVHPGAFVYVTNLADGMVLAARHEAAHGRIYQFRDDYDITWGEYTAHLGNLIGKRPKGNIPFRLAWGLGRVCEAIFSPLGVRPPMSRLAAGVMGRNLDVSNDRARRELGWESRVGLDEALEHIDGWVRDVYLPERTG